MPNIKLPDGSIKKYKSNVTVADVALDIGEGLARAAIAGKVANKLVDLIYEIKEDVDLSIITSKSPEGIGILRDSTNYLLAAAVKEIFPDAQVATGTVTEDDFYYDFYYKRPFTPEDLVTIQKKMIGSYTKKLKLLDERIFLSVISNGFRRNVKYTWYICANKIKDMPC